VTVLALRLSTARIVVTADGARRRSFYAALTVCDRTTWVQWWPRPIYTADYTARRPFLTAGLRLPNVGV